MDRDRPRRPGRFVLTGSASLRFADPPQHDGLEVDFVTTPPAHRGQDRGTCPPVGRRGLEAFLDEQPDRSGGGFCATGRRGLPPGPAVCSPRPGGARCDLGPHGPPGARWPRQGLATAASGSTSAQQSQAPAGARPGLRPGPYRSSTRRSRDDEPCQPGDIRRPARRWPTLARRRAPATSRGPADRGRARAALTIRRGAGRQAACRHTGAHPLKYT